MVFLKVTDEWQCRKGGADGDSGHPAGVASTASRTRVRDHGSGIRPVTLSLRVVHPESERAFDGSSPRARSAQSLTGRPGVPGNRAGDAGDNSIQSFEGPPSRRASSRGRVVGRGAMSRSAGTHDCGGCYPVARYGPLTPKPRRTTATGRGGVAPGTSLRHGL